ncbi:MAG: hypothetical protein ACHQ01_01645 [Candidatus Limnocylindrales bacterium]
METLTASERALVAERAWSLAKQRGDDRLRRAALTDYREARREARAQTRAGLARLDEIRDELRTKAVYRTARIELVRPLATVDRDSFLSDWS